MGNAEKDRVAEGVVDAVLGEAVWRNVVWLHRGEAVYEIRCGRGWGVRWTLELEEEGGGGREEGAMDGENGKEGEGAAADNRSWRIRKTTFRGFLEPIEGLDHELLSG